MDRIITVPGKGRYSFPSSMSNEDIDKAFKEEFPEWFPDPSTPSAEYRRKIRAGSEIDAPAIPPLPTGEDPRPGMPARSRTITRDEADNMRLEDFTDVGRITMGEGNEDYIWDDFSDRFRSESDVKEEAGERELIPHVIRDLPEELNAVRKAGNKAFRSGPGQALGRSLLRQPTKPDEEPPDIDGIITANAEKAGKSAVIKYQMDVLANLDDRIAREEERLKKAQEMDGGGKAYFDAFDARGYESMIMERNYRLKQLRKDMMALPSNKPSRGSVSATPLHKTVIDGIRNFAPALYGKPGALEGQPYAEGLFYGRSGLYGMQRKALGSFGKSLRGAGKGTKSLAAVYGEAAVSLATGDWTELGRNNAAWRRNVAAGNPDAPLPMDRDLAELSFEQDTWAKIAGELGGATAEMLPFAAVFHASHALGLTSTAGQAGLGSAMMGFNEDGSINPMGIAIGAGLPGVSKIAGAGVDKVLASQWLKTAPALEMATNRTGDFLNMAWKSHGKEMTKRGISKQKFIQDWGNAVKFGGQTVSNGLYLAALQAPGVLESENPKEEALKSMLHFAPWVLYGFRPSGMRGMPVETIQSIRSSIPRNTVISESPAGLRVETAREGFETGWLQLQNKHNAGITRQMQMVADQHAKATTSESRLKLENKFSDLQKQLEFVHIPPEPMQRPRGVPTRIIGEIDALGLKPVQRGRITEANFPRIPPPPLRTITDPGGVRPDVPIPQPGTAYGTPRISDGPGPRGLPAPVEVPAIPVTPQAVLDAKSQGAQRLAASAWLDPVNTRQLFENRSAEEVQQILENYYNSPKGSPKVFQRRMRELGYQITSNMKLPSQAARIVEAQEKLSEAGNRITNLRSWANRMHDKYELAGETLPGDFMEYELLGEGWDKNFPGVDIPFVTKLSWFTGGREKGLAVLDQYLKGKGITPSEIVEPTPKPEEPSSLEDITRAEADERLVVKVSGLINEAMTDTTEEGSPAYDEITRLKKEFLEEGNMEEDWASIEQQAMERAGEPEPAEVPAEEPLPEEPVEPITPSEKVVVGRPAPLRGLQKGKSMDAQYAWAPKALLNASHGEQFKANEKFAPLKNTRDYSKDKTEQEKVIKTASEFEPLQYNNFGASAEVGPIMVSQGSDGVYRVLGGNARFQAINNLSKEQFSELRRQSDETADMVGLPKSPSSDHLLVRILPPHDVSSKEGIAAANEIIDLLNPSAGQVEGTASMAFNDAALLSPQEVGEIFEAIKDPRDVISELIAMGRIDRNTRVRVTQSMEEATRYARMLTTAKAFGTEHGPFIADWAEASALPLYKGFINSPIEALLTLQQKGYQDITEPFGVLVTRVIERHESKPREGLPKDLAHIYGQRELIADPGYEAAQLMALRMKSLVQYGKAGRPNTDSTIGKWEEFWNKTTIQAAESLDKVDPQEALFDDVNLKFYQNFKDTVIADMGPGELQAEEVQYLPFAKHELPKRDFKGRGIQVFHGSKKDFPEFITSSEHVRNWRKLHKDNLKNFHGWGTYFTGSKEYARSYQGYRGAPFQVKLRASLDEFLVESEPLGSQSEVVKKAFADSGVTDSSISGHDAYLELSAKLAEGKVADYESDRKASELLFARGVMGLTYTGLTRAKNYVVFDDSVIEVKEQGVLEAEEIQYLPSSEGDPQVKRLNELYKRLKQHEENQLKKPTGDRKPVPQKLSDEIYAIEQALGQEFMGFFKQTRLREEELAKRHAEKEELKKRHQAKKKPPAFPITNRQQDFLIEPGAQMGLFEASSAQYLPFEEGELYSTKGEKAADPRALREGAEVELKFGTPGLQDFLDTQGLTEDRVTGIGQVTSYKKSEGKLIADILFEEGGQLRLEWTLDGMPVEAIQPALYVYERGAVKEHERILGPKEAKAEGIQKEIEFGDKRELPPPPNTKMIRARADLVPKLKDVWGHKFLSSWVKEHHPILKPHQADAVVRSLSAMIGPEGEGGHFLNSSGTGSGKTMTQLAIADYMAKYGQEGDYTLILTENRGIMHSAFAKDAELMGIPIYEFGGKPPEKDKKIYIGTYTDVQMMKVKPGEFNTIIMDEAHNIRNMLINTATAKRADRLIKKAKHVMYATASPMDQPHQVYAYRNLLDISVERAMAKMGLEQNAKGQWTPIKGMTWEQIEENIDVVWEDVYAAGRAIKDEVPLNNTEIFYRNVKLTPRDVLTIQKKMELLEEQYLATSNNPTAGGLERLKKNQGRKFLESVKMKYAIDEAKKHIKDGKKVILFAHRVAGESTIGTNEETLAAYEMSLQNEGVKTAKLFGPMTKGKKQAEMAKFQEGVADIVLATPGSGGTGVSLDDVYGDKPRVTIIVTPPYSSLEFVQMIGRASRLTTQSKSEVVVPLTTHPIDRWNIGITLRKLEALKAAVKGDIKKPEKAKAQLEAKQIPYITEEAPVREQRERQKAEERAAFLKASLQSSQSVAAREHLLHLLRPGSPLPGGQLISGIDFEVNKFGVADLLNRRVEGEHEVAALTSLIRNPYVESSHLVGLDNAGNVIISEWGGLGAPHIAPAAKDFLSRALALGVKKLVVVHNEPIGEDLATSSPRDQEVIDAYNDFIPTIGIVHNFTKYKVLNPNGPSEHHQYPKELIDSYLTARGTKQSASLIGKNLSKYSPEIADYVIDANAIAKSISESKYGVGWGNNLAVALLGPHGHLRAVIEMDPALAVTNDGIDYVRRQAAAAGATKAFGVYTAENIADSKHYSGFVNLHQSGVFADIMGYADINQTALQKISQRLPQPTLPNHLLGVPIESWGEFEAQSAEYNPSNESSDEAYTYRMLGPGGKMTKVPVKLGGMENVRPMKMTWLVKLYESVMGKRPKVQHIPSRGGMKIHGYHKGGDIVIDVGMFTDEMRAAQTLAHEIGHWVDFMDDRTMARGNVIGRLKSLHNFMEKRFGNLSDAELREELKELSMYWRPWDPANSPESFKKYRNSSKELYADALSVLFNDPALLQEMAPNFYRGFFEGIDSKPQLSQELIKLWETLDNDYVDAVQGRINDSLEEYAKADEIIKQKAEEARNRRKHWKSWWDHLSFMFNYRHSKFEKKLVEAKDRGYNPSIETDPRVMVEESLWWAENHNTRYLKKSFDVIKELEAEGVSYDVLGKWLELDRIINERSSLANPGGIGPLAAKEQLIALRNRLGPRRSGLIQNWAAPRLHDLFFEVAEMAAQEGVINATTFDRVIKPNRNAYVPFAVMKYLQASMPAGVKRQYGTFEKIANPLTSMLMKAVSMHNFIAVNKAKRTVRDHLLEWHGGDIKKTAVKKYRDPAIKDREANPFWEKPIPDPDFGILTVFENGRPVHYDVDPLIADGFNHETHASLQAMAGFFTETFQKWLYPIFITYNIGFHGSNVVRDFGRTRRTLKLSRREMLGEYLKAMDAGFVRMKGSNEHPLLAEMMGNMAIGPANKRHTQHYDEQGTVGQQLEEYGLINPEPETLMDKLGKYRLMSWMANLGDLFEALPKISTYKYLRRYNKKTPRDAGFTVRNYAGTPHTRRAGAYASIIKAKIPFFNVFKEGMKADYEMASGSYGHTRTHPHKKGHSSPEDKAKKKGWERARTAAGWWWWYVKAHGLLALFQGLSDGGFIGDDAKELYNGVSEYDKTNYLIVPLGQQAGGDYGKKTVYIRIPRDFTAQFVSGLIYKLTRQFGDNPSKLHEALNYTVEQGPSDNPLISVPGKWLEYAQGRNPEDAFRDRPILNRTQEGLRGLEGAKGMATWSLNQMGARDAFNFTKLADDEQDGFIASLALHTPLVNRFLKVSDYGYREQQFNQLSEKQRASLIHREKYGEATKDALRKYYQLQRFGEQGRTPQQEADFEDLSFWYQNDFNNYNTDILSAMELGMKAQAEKLRRHLEKITETQFKQ